LDVDGEQPGQLPAVIDIVPKAIQLLIPSIDHRGHLDLPSLGKYRGDTGEEER